MLVWSLKYWNVLEDLAYIILIVNNFKSLLSVESLKIQCKMNNF